MAEPGRGKKPVTPTITVGANETRTMKANPYNDCLKKCKDKKGDDLKKCRQGCKDANVG